MPLEMEEIDIFEATNETEGVDDTKLKLLFPIIYVTTSSMALACNFIILAVLIRSPKLMFSYAFIVGLTIGDLLYSLAVITIGSHRLRLTPQTYEADKVPRWFCFALYVVYYLVGNQIQSLNLLLINIDRFLAIAFAVAYFKNKSNRIMWTAETIVYVFSIVSVSFTFLNFNGTELVETFCYTGGLVSTTYLKYHFGFGTSIGVLSAVFAALMIIFYLKKMKRVLPLVDTRNCLQRNPPTANGWVQADMQKQIHLTKAVICIALVDFSMVVLPNFLLFSISFDNDSLRHNFNYFAGVTAGLRCCCSLPIYLRFNQDFSQGFKRLWCGKK